MGTDGGGLNTTPDWTVVDGTQDACGTCHGLPPDYPHVDRADCESCHPDAGPGQTITTAAQHIDGTVQLVISAENPGVDNWMDTAGHDHGTMCVRWVRAKDHPHPQCKVVDLASL